jgi:hypothetical protein
LQKKRSQNCKPLAMNGLCAKTAPRHLEAANSPPVSNTLRYAQSLANPAVTQPLPAARAALARKPLMLDP